jgi:perosamine synthetase
MPKRIIQYKPESLLTNWPRWPKFGSKEINAAIRVVKSNQLFADKEVLEFENMFRLFNKSKYVRGVGNATQGLHLALSALNIGFKDEVIVTSFSWVSTASCILMQNATPVFVDIERDTLGADPQKILKAITKKTKAIIVVHMFGNPCKIKEIAEITKVHGLYLIEDASHAHGSKFMKKKIGNFSDIAVFSVHQRKNLPAGEGGLIVCKTKELDNKIYKLRSFGEKKLSYNYRMTEFSAAIGKESLKKLNKENIYRNQNAKYFNKLLKNSNHFKIIMPQNGCYSSFHKLPIIYNYKNFKKNINFFINYINKKKIPFQKAYIPLHHHSNFNQRKNIKKSFPNIKLNYKKQIFKNTEEISYRMLLELSIHRPVNKRLIKLAYNIMQEYIKKYAKKI